MFKILILICLGVCYVKCETQCQTTFHTCLKGAFDKLKSDHSTKPNSNSETSEFEKCFTDSGCTVPKFENNAGDWAPKFNISQVKECHKKVAKDIVENCVRSKFSKYEIPSMSVDKNNEGKQHQDGLTTKGRQVNGKDLKMSCKNDSTKARTVKTCLDNLHNKTIRQHNAERQNPKNVFCDIKNNCSKTLSPECQTEMTNVKSSICQCSTDHADEIKKAMSTCLGNPDDEKTSNNNNNSKGRNKLGQPSANFLANNAPSMLCDNGGHDMCDNNVHDNARAVSDSNRNHERQKTSNHH